MVPPTYKRITVSTRKTRLKPDPMKGFCRPCARLVIELRALVAGKDPTEALQEDVGNNTCTVCPLFILQRRPSLVAALLADIGFTPPEETEGLRGVPADTSAGVTMVLVPGDGMKKIEKKKNPAGKKNRTAIKRTAVTRKSSDGEPEARSALGWHGILKVNALRERKAK